LPVARRLQNQQEVFMHKAALAWLVFAFFTSASAQVFTAPAKWSVSNPAEIRTGGNYRVGTISDFKTINPFTTAEALNLPDILSGQAGLLTFDPAVGDYVPYMAANYTISSDKLVWTFNLRKGIKWSDGRPVVADDFVTTFKIHTDEDVGSNSYDTFYIDEKPIVVSKVDSDTIKIVFPKLDVTATVVASFTPWANHVFGSVYASRGAAGVKAMWNLSTKPAELVTVGPWLLESYRPGERAVLVKNPTFGEWNKDASGRALPYLDGLTYTIYKDQNAWLAAYLASGVDTFGVRGADDLRQIRAASESGGLKAVLRPNIGAAASSSWIVFNWNKKSDPFKENLFRNDNFRRAMSHLTNRSAMVNIALGGFGQPAYTGVYAAQAEWISPTLKKFDFNLEAASGLLSRIGFARKNADGWLVNREGKLLEFELTTNAGATTREAFARIFADEAKKVGVKVNFRPIDFNTLVGQLLATGDERKFDAMLLGFSGGNRIYPLNSNVEPCGGTLHSFNTSGKCLAAWETQVTALFQRGRQEFDYQKRLAISRAIQDVQSNYQAFIYLVSPNVHFTWNARVRGEFPNNTASSLNGARYPYAVLTWIAP
jgi:peptide/nickel transport system substrate-binding protein